MDGLIKKSNFLQKFIFHEPILHKMKEDKLMQMSLQFKMSYKLKQYKMKAVALNTVAQIKLFGH